MSKQTNRDSDKFMLRLPEGTRERVKKIADLNRHSMNAEMVDAIERHLSMEEYRHSPEANQVSPVARRIFTSNLTDPSDLPATKRDIEILYNLIKRLTDDQTR